MSSKSITKSLMLLILLTGFSFSAMAVQRINVKDGDSIKVKISSSDVTRITIVGSGRIDKVWGVSGLIDVKPDKEKGEIYIRPLVPDHISFFVQDDLGSVYTLVAEQYEIPAETIYLKPQKKIRVSNIRSSRESSLPYVAKVKNMLKAMALGIDKYDPIELDEKVPLWKESKIRLIREYSSPELIGNTYTLVNRSKEDMILDEREFFNFGDNVRAVSLSHLVVKPKHQVLLYVVRGVGHGG